MTGWGLVARDPGTFMLWQNSLKRRVPHTTSHLGQLLRGWIVGVLMNVCSAVDCKSRCFAFQVHWIVLDCLELELLWKRPVITIIELLVEL